MSSAARIVVILGLVGTIASLITYIQMSSINTELTYTTPQKLDTTWIHTVSSSPLTVLATQATSTSTSTSTNSKIEIKKTAPRSSVDSNAVILESSTSSNTDTVASSTVRQVPRLENAYQTPPISIEEANSIARNALVNIYCTTRGGAIRPISGTGVVIDPRGVILTNAHVAQYVLLSESTSFKLDCVARVGSPAQAMWKLAVLYIPSVWVKDHASEINVPNATSTGEHDYALLLVTGRTSSSSTEEISMPFVSIDARETIAFPMDHILVAGYPAEFLGGTAMENNLYAATSETTLAKLLTFGSGSVDLYSLGGVIEAQSGSSGGAVINPWGRLIGLVVTTSPGKTTADRDLHALTLSYIDRDMATQTGSGLATYLSGDLAAKFKTFYENDSLPLIQKYFNILDSH